MVVVGVAVVVVVVVHVVVVVVGEVVLMVVVLVVLVLPMVVLLVVDDIYIRLGVLHAAFQLVSACHLLQVSAGRSIGACFVHEGPGHKTMNAYSRPWAGIHLPSNACIRHTCHPSEGAYDGHAGSSTF